MQTDVTYHCKGRRLYAKDKRQDLQTRLATLKQMCADKNLEAPLAGKMEELEAGLATLNGKHDLFYLGRAGCGVDLSAQIAAVPADGDTYTYVCPACGNTGTVRKARPTAHGG